MASVILVIHMFLALAIIGLVLIQRSEGGGLGIGGSGGGLGGLATPQGTANILTRATGFCAAGFFITSLTLGSIASHSGSSTSKLMDALDAPATATAAKPEGEKTSSSPDTPAVTPKTDKVDDNTAPVTTPAPGQVPSAPISE
jgi:preprotein translocase subunit SecG